MVWGTSRKLQMPEAINTSGIAANGRIRRRVISSYDDFFSVSFFVYV